jgi:phosphoglycerate dehydrogenase-like enzyme
VLAAVFFAKDLARLKRSQAAARWDVRAERAGRTAALLGLGDIGRVRAIAAGGGMRTLGLRHGRRQGS